MRIVADTNVLVSGLLSPHGPPGRIVDMVVTGAVPLLYDDRILAEYRAVLARPRFGFEVADVTALLDVVVRGGILVPAAPLPVTLPDPTDLPFLEVAVAGGASALVTGNARHFAPARDRYAVRILPPAAFLQLWLAERG